MSTRHEWSQAYARQAQADLDGWKRLDADPSAAACHRLLFLQMACEKLTKAHLCVQGSDARDLAHSHAYIAKNLPTIVRQLLSTGYQVRNPQWLLTHVKHLAREIEMLAPAIKRGGRRPDNCEYPWEDEAGEIHSPLDWLFASARLLLSPAGRAFLKLIRVAIQRFT
jgi:hypothetical protein